ncbi:MAG TPA: hypothetical protein VFV72_14520 [Candidatus Limnocylindrales bacterium]|nr:hypothetical protein [Candidatus Limnocylindrales bacterium]
MHKTLSALVSAGGSPGKLAEFGKALGAADLDIEEIGGAEWVHDGPLCLVLREDGRDAMDRFATVCNDLHVPWLSFATVSVELNDVPGSLGDAAEVVGDLNIYGVLVRKPHGNRAVVDLAFQPDQADEAVARLKDKHYTANRKKHPDEPDDIDQWDERTLRLLPLWDDPGIDKDDPRFWEPA